MSTNYFGDPQDFQGFTLPKAAAHLLNCAAYDAQLWRFGWQWNTDSGGAPFVTVHVGNNDTLEYFKYTWHTRKTGTLRLFTKLHRPAGKGVWTDGPSIKAATFRIREVTDQYN